MGSAQRGYQNKGGVGYSGRLPTNIPIYSSETVQQRHIVQNYGRLTSGMGSDFCLIVPFPMTLTDP